MPLELVKPRTLAVFEALDFAKKNYASWSVTALDAFLIAGTSDYVDGTLSRPADAAQAAIWDKNNHLACAYIRMCISEGERTHLRGTSCTTANSMWTELERRHRKTAATQTSLLDQALRTTLFRDNTMVSTANRVRDICKQIFEVGPLDEKRLSVAILLKSMTGSLAGIRENLEGDASLTIEKIIERLEREEVRVEEELKKTLDEEANAATKTPPKKAAGGKLCGTCGNPHRTEDCWKPGGAMEGKREEVLAKRAEKRKKNAETKETSKPGANAQPRFMAKDESGRAFYFTIADANTETAASATLTSNDELEAIYSSHRERTDSTTSSEYSMLLVETAKTSISWTDHTRDTETTPSVISPIHSNDYTSLSATEYGPFAGDTGATVHISPVREDFMTLRPIPPKRIWGVGGTFIDALGIGDIHIRMARNATLILRDALYVPSATIRLMSIGRLCDDNYCATFETSGFKIFKRNSNTLVATGTRQDKRLYTLNGNPLAKHRKTQETAAAASIETWHKRLGHIGISTIKRMAIGEMATGMPVDFSETPPSCEPCILGKQTRTPVPKQSMNGRATRKLAVVVVDLMGPSAVESQRHNHYAMDLVDEFSDMTWTISLRSKDQALHDLKAWERERKLECGEEVGVYRVDNGELKSHEMQEWLASKGTQLQLTAPYTSAHNGIAERRNRTVAELSRTMRIACNAPHNLWDYFNETAAYIIQRRPTTYQKKKTPFEAYYETKPDLSHLREIGCKAFVLIQNKHNPKVYDRSLECILIGYASNSKAYICYHRKSKKVITSYHVQFIESYQSVPQPLQPGRIVNNKDATHPEHPEHIPPPPSPIQKYMSFEDSDSDDDDHMDKGVGEDGGNVFDPDPAPAAGPRRTSRVPGPSNEARIEKAIEDAKASGKRIRADRQARREGRHIPNENDAHSLIDGIVLATLDEENTINLEYPDDPKSTKEALGSEESNEWLKAISEELTSIKDMGVYNLIPRSAVPQDRKVMRGKFVFHRKRNELGVVTRHKARYVLRGFEMIYGKDYTKTTSPTARMESLRILTHLAAANDYELSQLDVKTAYLYGSLDSPTYLEQPKGFEEEGKEDWVWELKKGLYGMKQGGRIWNQTMDAVMKEIGFTQLSVEHCIYYRAQPSGTVFAAVHVDDFTVASSSKAEEHRFEEELRKRWQISKGDASFVVGIQIRRDRRKRTVYLSQHALIDKILAEFRCQDVNPTKTPLAPGTRLTKKDLPQSEEEGRTAAKQPYRQLVGVLMYLAIATRPDIMHAVSTLSRFNNGHGQSHWQAAMHVVAYLKGTRNYELELGGRYIARLTGYTDSDYANCPDTRKSVSGYCFSLGSGLVSWMSKKQATTATSSTEAEYMAAASATKEAVWIRNVLQGLGLGQENPTVLFIDNRGARILTEDPSFHQRAKHIEVQHHYSRECAARGLVHFVDVPSKDNVADMFTKALPTRQFEQIRDWMGVVNLRIEEEC